MKIKEKLKTCEKKICAVLLAGLLGVTTCIPAFAAGSDIQSASSVALGSSYSGWITENEDADYYQFTLGTSGKVNLIASANMEYIDYCIYDSTGEEVWAADYEKWNPTTEISSTNRQIDLTSGTYYFVARKRYGCTGSYSFQLNYASADETFSEMQDGSDNSMTRANMIQTNQEYKGQIAQNDDKDFYKFTLEKSGRIQMVNTGLLEYLDYYLYDSAGSEVWSREYVHWNNTSEMISSDDTIDLTEGTYYLIFQKRYSSTGNYSFSLNYQSANESFAESQDSNDNSMYAANNISPGQTYRGQIADNDDKDFYKITLDTAGDYIINASAQFDYVDYLMFDVNAEQIWDETYVHWNEVARKSNYSAELTLTAGTYYFAVERRNSYTGNYSFSIAKKKITSDQTGSSSKTGQSKSSSQSSQGISASKIGQKISSSKSSQTTGKSSSKKVVVTGVKIKSVKPGKKKITIRWNKNSTCSGYQIAVRRKGTVKWKNYKVSSTKKVINKLKSKKKYQLRIRGYKYSNGKVHYGKWSGIKTVKTK